MFEIDNESDEYVDVSDVDGVNIDSVVGVDVVVSIDVVMVAEEYEHEVDPTVSEDVLFFSGRILEELLYKTTSSFFYCTS